jgi:hypothetical protein
MTPVVPAEGAIADGVVLIVVVEIAWPFAVVNPPTATFVVPAAVVNAFAAAATAAPPPTGSPAPLVITGVGAELIDEFTVCCGLAMSDGF